AVKIIPNIATSTGLASVAAAAILLTSCATDRSASGSAHFISGESVVLVGEEPAQLAGLPLRNQPLHVRSTYRGNLPQTLAYEASRDFIVDYEHGQIRRTAAS